MKTKMQTPREKLVTLAQLVRGKKNLDPKTARRRLRNAIDSGINVPGTLSDGRWVWSPAQAKKVLTIISD